MTLGTIFTTLHFLRNLPMHPISQCYITLGWKYLQVTKHSFLLVPFISYEEKELVTLNQGKAHGHVPKREKGENVFDPCKPINRSNKAFMQKIYLLSLEINQHFFHFVKKIQRTKGTRLCVERLGLRQRGPCRQAEIRGANLCQHKLVTLIFSSN